MAVLALLYWPSPKSLDFLLLLFTNFLKKKAAFFPSLFHHSQLLSLVFWRWYLTEDLLILTQHQPCWAKWPFPQGVRTVFLSFLYGWEHLSEPDQLSKARADPYRILKRKYCDPIYLPKSCTMSSYVQELRKYIIHVKV